MTDVDLEVVRKIKSRLMEVRNIAVDFDFAEITSMVEDVIEDCNRFLNAGIDE